MGGPAVPKKVEVLASPSLGTPGPAPDAGGPDWGGRTFSVVLAFDAPPDRVAAWLPSYRAAAAALVSDACGVQVLEPPDADAAAAGGGDARFVLLDVCAQPHDLVRWRASPQRAALLREVAGGGRVREESAVWVEARPRVHRWNLPLGAITRGDTADAPPALWKSWALVYLAVFVDVELNGRNVGPLFAEETHSFPFGLLIGLLYGIPVAFYSTVPLLSRLCARWLARPRSRAGALCGLAALLEDGTTLFAPRDVGARRARMLTARADYLHFDSRRGARAAAGRAGDPAADGTAPTAELPPPTSPPEDRRLLVGDMTTLLPGRPPCAADPPLGTSEAPPAAAQGAVLPYGTPPSAAAHAPPAPPPGAARPYHAPEAPARRPAGRGRPLIARTAAATLSAKFVVRWELAPEFEDHMAELGASGRAHEEGDGFLGAELLCFRGAQLHQEGWELRGADGVPYTVLFAFDGDDALRRWRRQRMPAVFERARPFLHYDDDAVLIAAFDAHADRATGAISRAGLGAMLQDYAGFDAATAAREAGRTFELWDFSGDGGLQYGEFALYWKCTDATPQMAEFKHRAMRRAQEGVRHNVLAALLRVPGVPAPLWKVCLLVTGAVHLTVWATIHNAIPALLRGGITHPTALNAISVVVTTWAITYFSAPLFSLVFIGWLQLDTPPRRGRLAPLRNAIDHGLPFLGQLLLAVTYHAVHLAVMFSKETWR